MVCGGMEKGAEKMTIGEWCESMNIDFLWLMRGICLFSAVIIVFIMDRVDKYKEKKIDEQGKRTDGD